MAASVLRAEFVVAARAGYKPAPTIYRADPGNRRSGESRNPGNPRKERAGYRMFWIPAFAGTTGLCCDSPDRKVLLIDSPALPSLV